MTPQTPQNAPVNPGSPGDKNYRDGDNRNDPRNADNRGNAPGQPSAPASSGPPMPQYVDPPNSPNAPRAVRSDPRTDFSAPEQPYPAGYPTGGGNANSVRGNDWPSNDPRNPAHPNYVTPDPQNFGVYHDDVQTLVAAVNKTVGPEASALVLIDGIASRLAEAGDNGGSLTGLANALRTHNHALALAVARNAK